MKHVRYYRGNTVTSEKRTSQMKNSKISIGAVVLGVLGLLLGRLLLANVFGTHHTLAYIVLAVGGIFVIGGGVGLLVARGRRPT
jgi:ABC-type enterochelin transport system permease subunit